MSVVWSALSPTDPVTAARLDRGGVIARLLAGELCRTAGGNDNCGALHAVWPELRLLGLAADPARHGQFYADALAALAASGATSRVLVAGCADWGMLELVADVYRRFALPLDATVVDRCPTPVLLIAWFGADAGFAVRTAVADLIEYRDAQSFDVICTHSLLAYPPLDARRRLVANWHRLLRPGGAVVTVSRLSTQALAAQDSAAAGSRAAAFADAVLERSQSLGRSLVHGSPADAVAVRTWAERFARAQVHHPIGESADFRALFEEQGFEVARLDVRRVEASSGSAESVVGAARSGMYGEIVAVKR